MFDDLSRCVKLDPEAYEAWNLLGELWWRQGTAESKKMGRNCFEMGLFYKQNRDSLLNLAQVLREPADIPLDQLSVNLEKSLKLCKEALAIDLNDGRSWFGIGSTYLKRFFSVTFDLKDLVKSLSAYNKAAACPKANTNADLYRNRAIIYQYLENYQQALEHFEKAAQLDPLDVGVDSWIIISSILRLLTDVSTTIDTLQAKFSEDKTALTIEKSKSVPPPFPAAVLNKYKELYASDLTVISSSGDSSWEKHQDDNLGYLVFIVLAEIPNQLPRTFIGQDKKGSLFAVSVFNVSNDVIRLGDVVGLIHPLMLQLDVDFDGKKVGYKSLRVDRPWLVSVNGRGIVKQKVACTQARFESL
ncbi:Tetratricopeptide repeat protein 5 [Chytridiales sp. JEL 0842]|nr:Tetratricopeptide repeat protein 5 [Chytridiales sp. JEL 0842]